MSRLISYSFCLLVAGLVIYAFSPRSELSDGEAPLNLNKLQINDMVEVGDRFVAVGERGTIVVSEDSGNSWSTVHSDAQLPVTLTDISVLSDDALLAVGHDNVILRSDDGGMNWEQVMRNSNLGEPLLGSWTEDGEKVFAFGSFGKFFVSNDGGQSFESRQLPGLGYHFSAMAGDSNGTRVLVGERGTVMRSEDQGESWTQLENFYNGSLFGIAHLADSRWVAYGMRGHVFYSADDGDSWKSVDVPNDLSLYGHALTEGGKKMVMVGTSGSYVLISNRGELLDTGTLGDVGTLTAAVTLPDGELFVTGQRGLVQGSRNPLVAGQ